MALDLEDMKNRLRRSYLGRAGIHGIGVSHAADAIRVYVGPDVAPNEQEDVLDQLREAAKPFPIVVVREDRAAISDSD